MSCTTGSVCHHPFNNILWNCDIIILKPEALKNYKAMKQKNLSAAKEIAWESSAQQLVNKKERTANWRVEKRKARSKEWLKRNIKINHFDKVKGRQKSAFESRFSFSLTLSFFIHLSPSPLIYVTIFKVSFSVAIRLHWIFEACWLKEKLLPKCNLNLRSYPTSFSQRESRWLNFKNVYCVRQMWAQLVGIAGKSVEFMTMKTMF